MKTSLVSRFFLLFSMPLCLWIGSSRFPTPSFLLAAGGRYEVREVRPHVFVWIPEDIVEIEGDPEFSRAGTAGFIVTPDGVVVIDTANTPFHGREIYYEIGHRTDAPVKYVVDTDSEGSHTLGNEVFVDEQAVIISTPSVVAGVKEYQQQLARRLEGDWRLQARMRGIHVTPPSRTFQREMRLDLPGEEIRLVSLNAGDSNAAVYLPQSRALFLGNLFENGFLPTLGLIPPPRDIRRWIQTLRDVENWSVDIYVPGHGPPGGKQEVAQFRQFLEWLANQVEIRAKAGKSLDQVKAELLPQVESRSLKAPELAAPAIEAVYLQLTASPGPSPPMPPSSHAERKDGVM
jgi:glyoxylase-like metal-dependent hydrolase (beta-lactamase superfamily II)